MTKIVSEERKARRLHFEITRSNRQLAADLHWIGSPAHRAALRALSRSKYVPGHCDRLRNAQRDAVRRLTGSTTQG